VRKYRKEHPGYNSKKSREYYVKRRKKVIAILGGKCVRCGIDDWRVLQINHLNGGGTKELKSNYPEKMYIDIINGNRKTDDLDLRCANCNILYEYERGVRKDDGV
jgi:5-methylcytosine-specific restriction endonuclease McrA